MFCNKSFLIFFFACFLLTLTQIFYSKITLFTLCESLYNYPVAWKLLTQSHKHAKVRVRLCYTCTCHTEVFNKKTGEIHKYFCFTSSHTLSGSAWWQIWLLPLCKGSDHFDMLIHSFQTAGICTCINSKKYFIHKHVKIKFPNTEA